MKTRQVGKDFRAWFRMTRRSNRWCFPTKIKNMKDFNDAIAESIKINARDYDVIKHIMVGENYLNNSLEYQTLNKIYLKLLNSAKFRAFFGKCRHSFTPNKEDFNSTELNGDELKELIFNLILHVQKPDFRRKAKLSGEKNDVNLNITSN